MEILTGRVITELSVSDLFAKHCELQKRTNQKHPWWDCSNFPPKPEEIQRAIDGGEFERCGNDLDPHLEDPAWHIRRIAYLVCYWEDGHPLEMKTPLANMEINNGGHRLLAAYHLGKTHISAYEGDVGASQ